MKIWRALLAGILGAVAMSGAMYALRLLGVNIQLEALLGTLVEPAWGLSPWAMGFLMHLGIGAITALLYAAAFEFAVQRSGILVGGGFGVAHGMMAGLFMSGIPAMNPLGPPTSTYPGAFLSNVAFGPILFLLVHFVFGAVVGLAYGRPLQRPHLYTRRTA